MGRVQNSGVGCKGGLAWMEKEHSRKKHMSEKAMCGEAHTGKHNTES